MATHRNLDYGLNQLKRVNEKTLPYTPAGNGNSYNFEHSHSHNEKDLASGDHETRFINPAVYVEPLKANYEIESLKIQQFHDRVTERDCGDAGRLTIGFPHLSLSDNLSSLSASRSQSAISLITPSSTSLNQSKSTSRVERRCIIEETSDELSTDETLKYSSDGQRVKISASLSTSNFSAREYPSTIPLPRQLAHEEWVQKKKLEASNQKKETKKLEIKKKEDEKKLIREKQERDQRENENFVTWRKRKNQEEIQKRKLAEKEKELGEKLKEIEEKAAVAKEICLLQWSLNKNKAQKAQKEEQERKIKKLNEEKNKRMEESVKAFEEWRERTKNTPRPATQGLLPHQKAKPTYVNPIPWVSDDTNSDTPNKLPKNKSQDAKKSSEGSKNARKNALQH